MIKVADYIAERLADFGIRHVFMLTGGGAMHLNDAFGRNRRLRYFCNHHEQACAMGAEGYFRAAGRMAAVNVTSGPGGTNALTGVIGQWLDSIPCIYISGQVKQETTIAACPELKLRQLGDQEINITDIVRPVTKYAVMVRNPLSIGYHLDRALYLATQGRPGPVWLDIPLDVQAARIEQADMPVYDPCEDVVQFDLDRVRQQVAELLDRIKSAKRPVLLAGHGIRLAGAADRFIALAEALNMPVLTAICGHDLIWSDHPLFFGRPGICGDRLGNFVIQNSDLMLAIGARMGVRQISYGYDAFAREAFRAMVDVDENELKKPTLRMNMQIHCDARIFIDEMLRQLKGAALASKPDWLQWCRELQRSLPSVVADNPQHPDYVNSYVFGETLFKMLPPGSTVITGNGTAYTGSFQVMRLKKGTRVFTNQACASMGYDIPAAIGACLALGNQPVVLLTGDGSIQMNIQEFQTIVANRMPVKIFMLNNQGYLSIRITQNTYFEGHHFGIGPASGVTFPNISKVAGAYGMAAMRIGSRDPLEQKIAEALAIDGPVLCEIEMDPDQTVYPKLSSIVKADGTMVSCPFEDMYPFLPRDEFKAHMIIPPLNPA